MTGGYQERLAHKLGKFQHVLKSLKFNEFNFLADRAETARKALDQALTTCDGDPLNAELRGLEVAARQKSIFYDEAERSFYSQRAKINFLNLSDKNTKFFYSMEKKRQARNTMSFLCKDDGEVVNDTNVIITNFIDFYKNLFGVKVERAATEWSVFQEGYMLSAEDKNDMAMTVTNMERKQAIFDIGNEKSPGLDGYTTAFFKKNWQTVGQDVIAAV